MGSDLADDGQDARIAVRVVLAAHGGQLAIAEEADDGEIAEELPDQGDVVVCVSVQTDAPAQTIEEESKPGPDALGGRVEGLQHPTHIGAGGPSIAQNELDDLPLADLLGHGYGAGAGVYADKVPDQQVPLMDGTVRILVGDPCEEGMCRSLDLGLGQHGDCFLETLQGRAAVKLDDLVRFRPANAGRLPDRLAPLSDPEAEGEFTSQEQAGYGVDPDLGAAPLEALSLSGSARRRGANDRERGRVFLHLGNQLRNVDTAGVGEEDKQPWAFG